MSEKSGIGERVKRVREDLGLSQQEIADRLGVALRSWQRIERGEGVPSGETLLKFESTGFNPGWVLTGVGPVRMSDARERRAAINARVMEQLAKLVKAVHSEFGVKLPGTRETAEAADMYNELLALVSNMDDSDEVEANIPLLRFSLKKRLKEAASKPGTGKRRA